MLKGETKGTGMDKLWQYFIFLILLTGCTPVETGIPAQATMTANVFVTLPPPNSLPTTAPAKAIEDTSTWIRIFEGPDYGAFFSLA